MSFYYEIRRLKIISKNSQYSFNLREDFKQSKEIQRIYANKIFWVSVSRLYTPSLTVNFWCLFSFNKKRKNSACSCSFPSGSVPRNSNILLLYIISVGHHPLHSKKRSVKTWHSSVSG